MFNDGYSEEIARRKAEHGSGRSVGDWIAFVLAVPAAWLFWSYVAQPVWQFVLETADHAEADRIRMEALAPMLGGCFRTPIGSTGMVIRIENGSEVKMAFKGGVTGYYPTVMLTETDCPKD